MVAPKPSTPTQKARMEKSPKNERLSGVRFEFGCEKLDEKSRESAAVRTADSDRTPGVRGSACRSPCGPHCPPRRRPGGQCGRAQRPVTAAPQKAQHRW